MRFTRSTPDADKWYDEIRSQIWARSSHGNGRGNSLVVALTSMKSGEGVTTAALGLARSFEREAHGDVLMILAKETPGEFDSTFVGVQPRVIGDDLLFATADGPARDNSEPYLVLPPMLHREQANGALDIVGEPANDAAAAHGREPGEPAHGGENGAADGKSVHSPPHPSSDVVALPREVIQRFGGIRPMARAMNVPASTVASWKRRGRIPRNRRQQIAEALGEPLPAPTVETTIEAGAPPGGEANEDQIQAPSQDETDGHDETDGQDENKGVRDVARARSRLGSPDERMARQILKAEGLPAAEVIDLFGGAQALADALDMPITMIRGWEAENRIPDLYHATIRLAARERGEDLDDTDLLITSPAPVPTAPAIPARGQEPPLARRAAPPPPEDAFPPENAPPEDEDALPIWQRDAARPEERYIVSLGEMGPDALALGTCGLNGSGYGHRWESTFRQLRETYSVIIVDASSLETPIPKLWRDQTSQTLLVIDSTKTSANELRRMSRLTDLSGLRLSGTILNKTVR